LLNPFYRVTVRPELVEGWTVTRYITNEVNHKPNKGETPMKKQIKVSLTISAAVLAMSGIAHALPAELNIYGASAQYTYMNDQAQKYAQATVANGGLGCTATVPVNNNKKHGFVAATACVSTLVPVNSATGTRDLDIRYSGIASAEGPLAASKQAPLDATLATGCDLTKGERLMFASTSSLVCKTVHIGTSDVAGESLTQQSYGMKFGPNPDDGAVAPATPVANYYVENVLTGVNTTGLTPNNTVVVPFGFFVNAAVTAQTCTTGLVGNYCTTNAQCGISPSDVTGVCGAAATITNISREEAVLIFSQGASNWSDFGSYFTAKPIVACLRHAGSGTHSALDLTVMNANWGGNIAQYESAGSVYFNQASGDEIKCINGATTASPTGSLIGAIGYADADQAIGVTGTSQNVKQLKYNGFYPTRTAIRNGLYDFYTNAWLYTNGTNLSLANSLIAYAKKPANIPASKANYWATVNEMKFNRGTDGGYPAFTGATNPMTP
jgi:ABC-type phosphate transport system substrate-binding protein